MEPKRINGKAIYSPKGKAGEYATYACNFYVGCSNNCDYCYCKKGVLGHAMGAPKATLKKCFKDECHAYDVFTNEVKANLEPLREYGLFFTFTSDPMLKECINLTKEAVRYAISQGIHCTILTKRADFLDFIPDEWVAFKVYSNRITFGFTLTGHDELEPGASTNAERIECMRKLHVIGFKTFASIEPIVDLYSSFKMIDTTKYFCDIYKIGLMSGKRNYTPEDVLDFTKSVEDALRCTGNEIYFKKSVTDYISKLNK